MRERVVDQERATKQSEWETEFRGGDGVALELAAKALGITAEQLRSSIEWHEQYMRFHDGDYNYRIL